jgi:hypothetical protein
MIVHCSLVESGPRSTTGTESERRLRSSGRGVVQVVPAGHSTRPALFSSAADKRFKLAFNADTTAIPGAVAA